ncbi:MAG TPA: hypothetical protein VGO47_09225, partial [Chlamydiales bacterium]|nr:hypothetical protein [Chlamydiales bacterium]
MILLGYMPVTKLECIENAKERQKCTYRLFHYCLLNMLGSLQDAGHHGVEMVCGDRQVWHCYPIFADFPEQCLVAGCQENLCPVCKILPTEQGEPSVCPHRTPHETLRALKTYNTDKKSEIYKALSLRPLAEPFWSKLPHVNIFECFTPDLLHQLHKGVFKDHLVKWCMEAAVTYSNPKEIDKRFKCMPHHPSIRHFKKGISAIAQWTGKEIKEIERVFVSLLFGAVPPEVTQVARAIVDFIYYASFSSHLTETIRRLQDALETFH